MHHNQRKFCGVLLACLPLFNQKSKNNNKPNSYSQQQHGNGTQCFQQVVCSPAGYDKKQTIQDNPRQRKNGGRTYHNTQ